MQRDLNALEEAGIRVVAISVDPPETSRDYAQRMGYTFTILSDPSTETVVRYDLLDPAEGVARPAEFLLDRTGRVVWRNLAGSYYRRLRPDDVLEAARNLP
jgi:peroxiredoxin